MSARAAWLALWAVLCLVPAPAGQVAGTSAAAAARLELERGDELRAAARGVRGRERLELRARAVQVYASLRRRFPLARDEAALGAFRAGELLRSDGRAQAAGEEFEAARRLARPGELQARAGLELGHLARRAGLHAEALAHYADVAAGARTAPRERDLARLWSGRSQAALGRHREARATLEALAQGARDATLRVSAFDERALSWIVEGDLEAAAGELARCRRELRARALEQGPQGERVRSALRRMRAVGRLRAAVAERLEGVEIDSR